MASKSTDRCVNPTTDALAVVRLSSPRFHPALRPEPISFLSSFLLLPDPNHRHLSSSHRDIVVLLSRFVQYRTSVRSEERSGDPGDRRVVTVIPQKRFRTLAFFPQRGYPSPSSFFPSPALLFRLPFYVLIASTRPVSLRPRVSDGRVDFHEQIDRDETGTVSGVTIKRASTMRTQILEKSSLS